MDEDYKFEGNEDDDDGDEDNEFSGCDDDMYFVPSQEVGISQNNACNDRVKRSMRHYGSMDTGVYTSHVYNLICFDAFPKPVMDVKNTDISNWDTHKNNNLKVIGFYNSKTELKVLFQTYMLEIGTQWKVCHSNRVQYGIKCIHP